jgi:hypothetical protein
MRRDTFQHFKVGRDRRHDRNKSLIRTMVDSITEDARTRAVWASHSVREGDDLLVVRSGLKRSLGNQGGIIQCDLHCSQCVEVCVPVACARNSSESRLLCEYGARYWIPDLDN